MVVSFSGIAGARGSNPTAIVMHNDAGSQNATASFYKKWLESHTPSLGFAHYYVASDGTFQAEHDRNRAWHTGNATGNAHYLGIEICQSLGDEATYLANEQKAFKLAADLCKKYGLNPATAIFPLHRELSATSCPHRAWELHGKSVTAIKNYYTGQVKKYFDGGSAVATPTPQPTPSPAPTPTPAQPTQLAVDGSLGPLTAKRWQEVTKMQIKDGRISHQWRQEQNKNIHAAIFDSTLIGSNLIRDTQRKLAARSLYTGKIDGLCGEQTIRAMQRAKGTTVDGIISAPQSQLVMAIQRDLNAGRSPF